MTGKDHTTAAREIGFPPWLAALTALLCGWAVMVLEIMGSRVIGPFFGASLFVWTSLIAVTMIALAAGYWLGGKLADRSPTPDTLYLLIAAAGGLTCLTPLYKSAVIKACVPLGLRLGSFSSALILFGPPLFLMGCVSPYLVRLSARNLDKLGSYVGGLYSLSTVGSIIGTVGTGFVLIAYLGVTKIFLVVGGVLLLLSALYWLLLNKNGKLGGMALLILLAAVAVSPIGGVERTHRMDSGTLATLLEEAEGFYGNVKVVDYTYGVERVRELTIDGMIQGGVDLRNGLSIYEYLYMMEYLPMAIRPGGKRCLVLGLGAGTVPMWYERHGVTTDVVDIDENVVRMARKYFGFRLNGNIFVEDARYFLESTERRYDYVILDVYNGDSTPFQMLSVESFTAVKRCLAPGGVIGVNLHGAIDGRSMLTNSVVATMGKVFGAVDIFPVYDTKKGDHGNLALMGHERLERDDIGVVFDSSELHPVVRQTMPVFLGARTQLPGSAKSFIISDEFNPADFLDIEIREETRKNIIETTPWGILLGYGGVMGPRSVT